MNRLASLCSRCDERYLLIAILVLTAVLRISRAYFTPILNVDSALYLFQAKALYYGQWQTVNSCVLKSVSLHPIFSSMIFAFTHNWIVSMVATSILFSTLTIIPIYYTTRLYFPLNTSLIVALIYSVMHIFVTAGVDVTRDTPYWFFSACGLYFFSAGMKKDYSLFFPASSIFFMLAAWNRIEAVLFLAATPIYLFFKKTDRKSWKIAEYLAPILFGIGLLYLMQALDFHLVHKRNELIYIISDTVESYQNLRINLHNFIKSAPTGFEIEFLRQVRALLWMLGINIVIENSARAFFYPFFLVFLLGFLDFKKWRENNQAFYYAILIAGAFFVLYFFVLRFWFLEHRYLTLLILPSFIFIGFGVERILSLCKRYLKMNNSAAILLFTCLVLACALPDQLKSDNKDKEIFARIGSRIAQLEGSSKGINILVMGAYFKTFHLYSNLNSPANSCPDDGLCNNFGNSYEDFLNSVNNCKASYVIWQEKYQPAKYDFLKEYNRNDFLVVGEWHYKETGKIILFRRLVVW